VAAGAKLRADCDLRAARPAAKQGMAPGGASAWRKASARPASRRAQSSTGSLRLDLHPG